MKQIKILSIGNSFSQDAQGYLHDILNAYHVNNVCYNLYIGGCSLERHYNNMIYDLNDYVLEVNGEPTRNITLSEGLELDAFDIVTIQQSSPYSGIIDSYEPFLEELLKFIKVKQPNALTYFHETWAYESNSTHQDFYRYNHSRIYMFNKILECMNHVLTYNIPLIESGKLIEKLRSAKVFNFDNGGIAITRDGFHMNIPYGRYALGLLWAKTFLNVDPTLCDYFPSDTDKDVCLYIQSVVRTM